MRNVNIANQMSQLDTNEIARNIIGAAINVHRYVGLGLHENTYKACLLHELEELGLNYEEHVNIPFFYKNRFIDSGVTVALLVEGKIMVDVQTVESISEQRVMQVLNHLRHADLSLGLILNFNTKFLKGEAIRRVVNGEINQV